ncbi:MAG: response regulator transcription factor [Flavobacteriales bacterium]|nr:response regulator transcription factor [Flavobacteriales bacterium]
MKLLFVEDDRDLLKSLLFYFNDLGYTCEKAKTVEESIEKVSLYKYDCVVLDLTLPDGSGLELLKILKSRNIDIGVIILSANSNLDDKLNGLDLGADDYLTKPFHLSELNSRIKSIIRRKQQGGTNLIQFNEILINSDAKEVKVNDSIVTLTKKEYDLLMYLVLNKNKVVTKASISEHLWGDYMDQADSFDSVYSHMKNLKRKLKSCGSKDYLKSLYGVGYILKES